MIEFSKKAKGHLHCVFTSDFEHLDQIVDKTEAFLAKPISDNDLAYKIVLLVSEAVTNAIEHGNKMDESKKVYLDLKVGSKQIQITVEDEGEGFERESVENPADEANLLMDGGRGIFFIEEMADKVAYEKNGRRVQIFFNR